MSEKNKTQFTSVVTGGAGFLGSHLSDRLLAEGHRVIAIDNLITGNVANIEHFAGNEQFHFIKQDISEYLYLPGPVDYIFHFASPASPFDYLEFPIQTLKVGALGTHKCLGLARARMRPRDGRVVPTFVMQALNKEPITVFGDGSQTRSFCFVSDLIDGIFRLAMSSEPLPVNIGNPSEMTVLEFAERINRICNSNCEIIFEDLPVDDPKVRQPDIARAREILGWAPKMDLDQGLELTIQYFQSLLRKGAV